MRGNEASFTRSDDKAPDKTFREEPEKASSAKLQVLPLSKILIRKKQVRRHVNEEALQSLVASIRTQGIIEPVIVREAGRSHELVCGHRRVAAAKILNLEEVPAVIRQIPEEDIYVVALHENLHRNDMNPIEEAESLQHLLDTKKVRSQKDLAKLLGISGPRVSQKLGLLELPEPVQDLMLTRVNSAKQLTEYHARVLRSVGRPADQIALATRTCENQWSVRELKREIGKLEKQAKTGKDPSAARRTEWESWGGGRYCRTRRGFRIDVETKDDAELVSYLEELIARIKK